jgi:NADPH:quinone reductase-like Zn-dependent oxidoreductase
MFGPGDDVFGDILSHMGGFAEYVCVPQTALAAMPAGLTYEQAAALPQAGAIAWQGIRDKGQVQPGQQVLINGGGGGSGMYAVQLARLAGAEVTGVDNAEKLEFMRSLGADHVIDYTREDFTRTGRRYDVLVDIAGSRKLSECRRVLAPSGVLVGVGAPSKGRWIGPMSRPVKMLLAAPVVSQKMTFFMAEQRKDDLAALRELLETGQVTPVIDRTYPLSEVPEAIRYLETGHARGKVVITI